jgi:hypothetical protein
MANNYSRKAFNFPTGNTATNPITINDAESTIYAQPTSLALLPAEG